MKSLIDTENGELYFGNGGYISSKTTFDEFKEMQGTVDSVFENAENGIRNLAFFSKEIDGNFHQISFHFHFGKLSMVFIQFKDGKQLTELPLWNELKRIKNDNHTRSLHEKMFTKEKKYDWGKLHAFYSSKVNLGSINIYYKRLKYLKIK